MNVNEISSLTIGILVLIGALLSFVSAIGILRLPDVYSRLHASSKSATLGVMFTLLGLFLFFGIMEGYYSARILLAILFVFATAPIGGHLISRAGHNAGVPLSKSSTRDDLKKKKQKEGIS